MFYKSITWFIALYSIGQEKSPKMGLFFWVWCGQRDSNSHALRRWNLNPVRLPISPRPRKEARIILVLQNKASPFLWCIFCLDSLLIHKTSALHLKMEIHMKTKKSFLVSAIVLGASLPEYFMTPRRLDLSSLPLRWRPSFGRFWPTHRVGKLARTRTSPRIDVSKRQSVCRQKPAFVRVSQNRDLCSWRWKRCQ